jgi:hypothetical protein
MEQMFQSMKRRLLVGAAAFLATAIGTYLVVEPMVPIEGWSWLIAGFVAVLVAYVVAQFILVLLVMTLAGDVGEDVESSMDNEDSGLDGVSVAQGHSFTSDGPFDDGDW